MRLAVEQRNAMLLLAFCLLHFSSLCESYRILMIPTGSYSHWLEMLPIGDQLLARKHEVFILMASSQTERMLKLHKGYQAATYDGMSLMKFPEEVDSWIIRPCSEIECFSNFFDEIKSSCTSMMEDKALIPHLKSLKFDFAIVDNFYTPCPFLIPHLLGIRFGLCATHIFPRYSYIPFLPSINQLEDGFETIGIDFCLEHSQCPRIVKVFRRMLEYVWTYTTVGEEDYLHKYDNFTSIGDLRTNTSLTIVNLDHSLQEVALPQLPGVELVGGLTVKPARDLPEELHKWLNQSSCVTLVSFGSRVGKLSDNVTQNLLDAFGRVRCDILFRCVDCQSHSVPKNVRLAGWIPQNDLLAHQNVKAFVTHSGNNGQYEALYHGVPMVAFYIDGDQLRNARRVERKGFGRRASLEAFEVEQLADLMNDVIENGTYKQAIQKASEIFRSAEHPVVRAANGIEKVLKFGTLYGNLITSEYFSVADYYSLDCLFVLMTLVLLLFGLLARFIAFVLQRFLKLVF